jgi:hypothetical protein
MDTPAHGKPLFRCSQTQYKTSGEVVRFTYEEFKNLHGQSIFGFHEPKKIIDSIIDDLPNDYGIKIETGIQVKHNGGHGRGFSIMRFSKDTEE